MDSKAIMNDTGSSDEKINCLHFATHEIHHTKKLDSPSGTSRIHKQNQNTALLELLKLD